MHYVSGIIICMPLWRVDIVALALWQINIALAGQYRRVNIALVSLHSFGGQWWVNIAL